MDTVLFWGIIAILCATCESIGIWKHGLSVGFIITTTLLAIHYDFGNDYWSYYDWFETSLYTPFPDSISAFLEISRDPGWDILNICFAKLFGINGFYMMVALLSLVEGICYYTFIKKSVPSQYYWLAMTMFVLNYHFFILSFSMMRQSLTMALLLLCFIWIHQRKIILPCLMILFAATLHNSILLCLPLVLIPYITHINQKLLAAILSITWLILLLASSILEPILTQIATFTDAFSRYVESYTESSNMTFGIGYLLRLYPFFYIIYALFMKQITEKDIPLILVWSLSIILIPFGRVIPLFSRLLFYFELAGFAVFPLILKSTQSRINKLIIVMSIVLLATYTLYDDFYGPDSLYYDAYLKFNTIFNVI